MMQNIFITKTSRFSLETLSLLKYVPFVPTCRRAFMPSITTCLRALIFHVPTCLDAYIYFPCLRSLNYFMRKCSHFSRIYVPTTTQDLGTDIYPADVKSDEN